MKRRVMTAALAAAVVSGLTFGASPASAEPRSANAEIEAIT